MHHPRPSRDDVDPFGLCGYLQESSEWPWLQEQGLEPTGVNYDDEPEDMQSGERPDVEPSITMAAARRLRFNFDTSSSDSEDEEGFPRTPQDVDAAGALGGIRGAVDSAKVLRVGTSARFYTYRSQGCSGS